MNQDASPYSILTRPNHLPRGAITAHVTELLREAIVSLQFKPGMVLDKLAICDRLGVSRSPVSEALGRLQGEGLIEIRPQRGSVVSLVSLAAVREYMFIRQALETEAVRTLAPRVTTALIAALDDNLDAQRRAVERDDTMTFYGLDLKFHDLLFDDLQFGRVKSVVDMARVNIDRARRLISSPRRTADTVFEHEPIVAALRARDADAAAEAMHIHIEAVMNEVFAFARHEPDLFADGDTAPIKG